MNIESRLTSLERQNRLLRALVVCGLILAALPWALGSRAAVEDMVRAKGFTLVDDEGTVLGTWSYDANAQTTSLSIQQHDGSPSVVLDANAKRSSVRLVGLDFKQAIPPFKHPIPSDQAPGEQGDIVLAATPRNNWIAMKDGIFTIQQHGKSAFVAPPKLAILPVKER
jgi:hypothetical protein